MKLKKFRNALLFALTLALISATAVAITYALGKSIGSAENTFTNEPTIKVDISEVDWDNSTGYNEATHNTNTYELGRVKAQKYYAGAVIPKNPKLTNTSTANNSEYVAMTVVYKVKIDGTWYAYPGYTEFSSALATVNAFNSNWTEKDANKTVFYYTSALAQNANTASLFDTVTINSSFPAGDNNKAYKITYYNGNTVQYASMDELPEFQIDLKGYAVSTDNLANAEAAWTPLNDLIAASNS